VSEQSSINSLSIDGLSKAFYVNNSVVPVLDNINLDIATGEFISIVGHSGCGKSTLLKIIAGLVPYNTGSVSMGKEKITEPGVKVGMIFQDHRLMPWMTVKENIAFGLYGLSKSEQRDLIKEHIELVGLKGFEKAYPHQLSGGMAQRAAIARALVHRPQVLLLDEPFGALDALTRIQMQQEILRIWKKEKTTMVLVTHDIDEAIYLGDRVIVMSNRPAKIMETIPVQLGRPRDRTSYDFSLIKEKVYSEFFGKDNSYLEYFI
jgi:sulfonate transport system ATP-binding protein